MVPVLWRPRTPQRRGRSHIHLFIIYPRRNTLTHVHGMTESTHCKGEGDDEFQRWFLLTVSSATGSWIAFVVVDVLLSDANDDKSSSFSAWEALALPYHRS